MRAGLPDDLELPQTLESNNSDRMISIGAWLVALSLFALALMIAWRMFTGQTPIPQEFPAQDLRSAEPGANPAPGLGWGSPRDLPDMALPEPDAPNSIVRSSTLHTIIPNRPRQEITTYTVQAGDSVFEIAHKFNLTPETVLWGNYAQLNDNPHLISIGMELNISPVNGVLYELQQGDTLESVAAQFKVQPETILNWSANGFDLLDPQVETGKLIVVPGGQREFRQWLIPTIPRGSAGVSKSVYGDGACEGSYEGAYGTGAFIWPAGNHSLSGNDYWSGHLGIDIAAGQGAPIYAADSGVVVFSGWATGGYGNAVAVDHGNGYQTLYAHLSSVAVRCGSSVSQGAVIGYAGSTGNSTGAHLHFEVRYQGGFISPWYVLPAP